MHLKTGVTCFEQRRVVLDEQFVDTFYPQLERTAEQVFLNGCHQREIAVFGCKVVHLQIVFPERWKYATQHQTGVELVEY